MDENARRAQFYNDYTPLAQKWASQSGIPASILLAWMASESNFGAAPSFFGVKGTGDAGSANLDTHEVYNGQTSYINDQFANYSSPDAAFQGMLDLVSGKTGLTIYKDAWNKLQAGDWQGFLDGINKAGYATDPNWSNYVKGLASEIPSYTGTNPDAGTPPAPAAPKNEITPPGGTGSATSSTADPTSPTMSQIKDPNSLVYTGQDNTLTPLPNATPGGDIQKTLLATQSDVNNIISDIKAGGKKTLDQIAQEKYGAPFDQLTSAVDRLEAQRAYDNQPPGAKSYTLADIQGMVKDGTLTADQAVQIFDGAFADGFTPEYAKSIRAELAATTADPEKGPAGLTDSQLRDAVVEGRMTSAQYQEELSKRHAKDWTPDRLAEELRITEEQRQKSLASDSKNKLTPFANALDPYGVGSQYVGQVKPFSGSQLERDALVQAGDTQALMEAFKRDNPNIPFEPNLLSEYLGSGFSLGVPDPFRAQNMDTFQQTGGRFIYNDTTKQGSNPYTQAQSLYDITKTLANPPPPPQPAGGPGTIQPPQSSIPTIQGGTPQPAGSVVPGQAPAYGDFNSAVPPAPPSQQRPDWLPATGAWFDPNQSQTNQITPPSFSGGSSLADPNISSRITAPAFSGSGGLLPQAQGQPAFTRLPDGRYIDANGQVIGDRPAPGPQDTTAINPYGQEVSVLSGGTRPFNATERNLYDAFPSLITGKTPASAALPGGDSAPVFSGIGFNPSDPNQGQRISDAIAQGGGLQGAQNLLQEKDRVALAKLSNIASQPNDVPVDYNAIAQSNGFDIVQKGDGYYIVDKWGNNVQGPFSSSFLAQQNYGVAAYRYQNANPQTQFLNNPNNFTGSTQGYNPIGQPTQNPNPWIRPENPVAPQPYTPPPPPAITTPAPPTPVDTGPVPRPTFTPKQEQLMTAMGI